MSERCDVLVVGGGAAGVMAAVAAARQGAHTIAVEPRDVPGGTAIAALHRAICGLYVNGPDAPRETLNGGLSRELAERLRRLDPASVPARMGRVWVLPFARRHLLATLTAMIDGEANLAVRWGWTVAACRADGDRAREVELTRDGARKTIAPGAIVDASGDAVILQSLGRGWEARPLAARQLPGYGVRLRGVAPADETLALQVPYRLAKAVQTGRIPSTLRFTTYAAGDEPGEAYLKLSVPPDAAATAATLVQDVLSVLREALPAFRQAEVVEMSPAVLPREGARMTGRYALAAEDVLGGHKCEDSAGRNAWPIEVWDAQRGPTYRYLPDGAWYEIPRGCLESAVYRNVFGAGRCLSATPEALGSARVVGACFATGEAAGRLACRG